MRQLLQVVALSLACVALSACGIVEQLGTGTSSGGAAGTSTGDGGVAADSGVTGANCVIADESRATLCQATSKCPTVAIDPDTHPHCGFRIEGSAVDLVCSCSGSLCPIGTFATCAQAAKLLDEQSEMAVCLQVSEGRCAAQAPAAGSTSTSSGSPCDRGCLSECGGGAGCAAVCGC